VASPIGCFDTEPNSFNVHQAALIAAYQPKDGFGAYLKPDGGPRRARDQVV